MRPLIAKLFAIIVVTPLAAVAAYACLWPFGAYPPTLGLAVGILIIFLATGLAFSFIKQSINGLAAVVGALIVAAVTVHLSLLLTGSVWVS